MTHDAVSPETLLQQLRWRYATKKFDATRKIPSAQWEALEHSLVLAPSSYGLQPWKFFVVDEPKLREQLPALSWGQTQPVECSHYLVMAARQNLSIEDIDRYLQRISEVRNVPVEALGGFRKMLISSLQMASEGGFLNEWSARQVYLALGSVLSAAAVLGIDACPMEGIEAEKYDELLGIKAQGFKTLCAVAFGYRAGDDSSAAQPKVRFPLEQIVAHI